MYGVIHDFQSMVLLDKIVGDSQALPSCSACRSARVTTPSLRSTVNLANPDANDDPGAAPNGADYVALQGANGQVLKGRDLRSAVVHRRRDSCRRSRWRGPIVNNDPTARATRCCARATPTTPTPPRSPR